MPPPRGLERDAPRCSESFFDNSKVRLRCESKTRPSGSNSWIYGRFAVPRIVTEKILIRAQGSLFRLPEKLAQDGVGLDNSPSIRDPDRICPEALILKKTAAIILVGVELDTMSYLLNSEMLWK